MKHSIKSVLAMAAVAVMLAGCNSQPTVEDVLRKSYQKCQSIQEGHYEMTLKKKWLSHNDTTLNRYTCDFRKLPNDTIYGKAFNSFDESWDSDKGVWDSEYSYHYLYTGNDYASFGDSTGTLMSCDLWAEDIIRGRHIRESCGKRSIRIQIHHRHARKLFCHDLKRTAYDDRWTCHKRYDNI